MVSCGPLFVVAPALKQSYSQLDQAKDPSGTNWFFPFPRLIFSSQRWLAILKMSARHRERKGTPGQRQGSRNLFKVRWVGLVGVNHETTPHENLFRLQIRRNVLISLLIFNVCSGKIS